MSPTQRTLAKLRAEGWFCEVVEHWVPWPKPGHRKDLWGFVDILCLSDKEIMGVQCTTMSNLKSRVSKISNHPNLPAVLRAGIRLQCWGWRKLKSGWQAKIVEL